MKIIYRTIRPYGTNIRIIKPVVTSVAYVFYNDIGQVIDICRITYHERYVASDHAEQEARLRAEHLNAAAWAILS
jgi:hypothetical protein